jgi:hypothetical protein
LIKNPGSLRDDGSKSSAFSAPGRAQRGPFLSVLRSAVAPLNVSRIPSWCWLTDDTALPYRALGGI